MTQPISLSDLIDGAPDVPAPPTALPKRRGRPPGSRNKVRRVEEVERAAVVAEREAHLFPAPAADRTPAEHETAAAEREFRIRENIRKSLAKRFEHGLQPMAAKQLALELAHFNLVHLSGNAVEVLERVAEYARDPSSPHHEWALKFMAERAMPLKMAQEAQLDAAGLSASSTAPRAPEVHIHIGAATPVRESDVIDAIPVQEEGS